MFLSLCLWQWNFESIWETFCLVYCFCWWVYINILCSLLLYAFWLHVHSLYRGSTPLIIVGKKDPQFHFLPIAPSRATFFVFHSVNLSYGVVLSCFQDHMAVNVDWLILTNALSDTSVYLLLGNHRSACHWPVTSKFMHELVNCVLSSLPSVFC